MFNNSKSIYLGSGLLLWVGIFIVFSLITAGPSTTASANAKLIENSVSLERGESVGTTCATCHDVFGTKNLIGPSLANIINRPSASISSYEYSDAMAKRKIIWTPENLAEFLQSPQKFVPGTKMGLSGLSADDAMAVVEHIKKRQ